MITINKVDYIGEGMVQKCYRHPENNSLCIKICKHESKKKLLARELRYWEKISKKTIKKNDYQFFSKYHGSIETNLGTGYVFDLVRDETNNTISKTLENYLLHPTREVNNEILKIEFSRLIGFMVKYKIIANDLAPMNICCRIKKDNTIQLIHIDGLGHKDLIPLVDWFSFFTKKKIQRRLARRNLNDLDQYRDNLIQERASQF